MLVGDYARYRPLFESNDIAMLVMLDSTAQKTEAGFRLCGTRF